MSKSDDYLPVELMLDSGAFSAWTHGDTLVLEEYIEYAKERAHLVDTVVNLDTIPGRPGEKRTPEQLEQAAQQSYETLQVMKKAGVPAIPVFHQGEDFKWLIRYIEEGEPYIGISPSGDVIKFDTDWFDECFRLCTNDEGNPIVKTHGFGVSSPTTLMRYPWYSADSATWALKSGYGSILIPQYDGCGDPRKGAKPDYSKVPSTVFVTGVSRDSDRFDYQTFGELRKACVDHFLEEEVGTNITVMMYHPHERMRAMLVYYKKMSEHLEYTSFPYMGGFDVMPKPKPDAEPMRWSHKKVITACGTMRSGARADMMSRTGIKHRLASYWEIRDLPADEMETYIKKGVFSQYKEGRPHRSWRSTAYTNWRRLRTFERVMRNKELSDEKN